MANGPKAAILYTGITSDLVRRIWQHKNKIIPGPPRVLRMLRLSRFRHRPRKGNQGLGSQQENSPDSIHESALGGPRARLAKPVQTRVESRSAGDPSPRW
ncbi:MAG TPA: hypothetical protein VEH47_05995 [Candidatus Acidoferrales bacterium]|nr:hypothetical protein [Candidatus Acidoferrales bacterium]